MNQKKTFVFHVRLTPSFFMGKTLFGAGKSVRFTECPLYKCPPYRGFIMRVWPKNIPFQRIVSVLRRCPPYTMSALDRFHCITFCCDIKTKDERLPCEASHYVSASWRDHLRWFNQTVLLYSCNAACHWKKMLRYQMEWKIVSQSKI